MLAPGILASVSVGLVLLGILGYATVRFLRRRVKYAQLSSDLNQRLLEESKLELSEMEEAWTIRPEEVNLTKALASGGFGDVWLAEWHDVQVAVKRLKQVRSKVVGIRGNVILHGAAGAWCVLQRRSCHAVSVAFAEHSALGRVLLSGVYGRG